MKRLLLLLLLPLSLLLLQSLLLLTLLMLLLCVLFLLVVMWFYSMVVITVVVLLPLVAVRVGFFHVVVLLSSWSSYDFYSRMIILQHWPQRPRCGGAVPLHRQRGNFVHRWWREVAWNPGTLLEVYEAGKCPKQYGFGSTFISPKLGRWTSQQGLVWSFSGCSPGVQGLTHCYILKTISSWIAQLVRSWVLQIWVYWFDNLIATIYDGHPQPPACENVNLHAGKRLSCGSHLYSHMWIAHTSRY